MWWFCQELELDRLQLSQPALDFTERLSSVLTDPSLPWKTRFKSTL